MEKVTVWWCFAMIVLYFPMIISFFSIGFYNRTPLHILEDGDKTIDGDMILTDDQQNSLKRTGRLDEKYRWPNKTVTYEFDTDCNDINILFIEDTTNYINSHLGGCIKFQRRKKEDEENGKGYVLFRCPKDEERCSSHVGYLPKNKNRIKLSSYCFRRGTIVHLCFHTLGLHHMNAHPTRSNYLFVYLQNVKEGYEQNFHKYSSDEVSFFDVPYDYSSIMHLSEYAFSKNGKKTIEPKNRHAVIGMDRVSELDWKRLRRMYSCE